jgi:hypothetical protein
MSWFLLPKCEHNLIITLSSFLKNDCIPFINNKTANLGKKIKPKSNYSKKLMSENHYLIKNHIIDLLKGIVRRIDVTKTL